MPRNKIAISYVIVLHVCIVVCIEPITTTLAIGGGIAAIFSAVFMKCSFTECCDNPYVALNYTGLRHDLNSRLHGQHLVIPTVLNSVKSHMNDADPQKPLVLSFHGWTGAGKNFVSQIIVDNIYKEKWNSKFVHFFNAEIHFKHPSKVDVYKDLLHSWIYHNVTKCERSIFIFDELDHMPEGMIDVVIPFLGHSMQVDGVDFRKAIFIFLSNTGGDLLVKAVQRQWENGKRREDIKLRDLQPVLEMSAYNQQSGLKKSKLIHRDLFNYMAPSSGTKRRCLRNLIDHFVPFLPLERNHVRSCIIDELRRQGISYVEEETISEILDELRWYPEDLRLYSKSGCKKISNKIAMFDLTR